ncbi:acyl-CoA dehydrogenase [Sulfolobus sp. A20]|uniref:acyl-CoA dehydrogenase family protein n=2 Tax=Sulfolobaceae TaxID=118883 RepID=UPI000845D38B|nr:acyl-CoA dehydrogenase family protein [Sulfolobus sp. A20]TRM79137.1 acyl-CoA dehydrogenase [Sulfolobus sp. B5]TRM85337.1 acyl-CoA dehydrogenase [Sulfolobus sp. F3]TRM88957.1 acyl-CoA dehydrogenase [Sulfolobus sp. E3]TRM89564.1 acyl-CoA dehydrogenase [Sulfolobus sp. C3]TRM98868.1 acyl-CoA dehydrogenase [Sulfolobus sp. F1]
MSEREIIVNTLREFLRRDVEKISSKIDEDDRFPRDLVKKLGELGFLLPLYNGLSHYDMLIILEEIAKVSGSLALIADAQGELAGEMLRLYSNESQKKNYLDPIAKGEMIGSFALSEPSGGSDVGNMKTKAEKDNGSWKIKGHKMWITQGLYADVFVTIAKTGDTRRELSVFLVPRDGCIETRKIEVMGNRGTGTAEVIFHDCKVSNDNVIGEINNGWNMVNSVLEVGRLAITGIAIGLAEASLEEALNWARSREAFGNKLYDFQGIRWYFANSVAKINSIRALAKEVSKKFDENSKDKGVYVSMLKLLSAQMANEVVDTSLQILGGMGYAKGTKIERIYRDVRLMRIGEGSDEVQRHIISKYIDQFGIPLLD